MRKPPEKRKPAAGDATGFQKIDMLSGKIDVFEDSPNLLHLQAVRLRNRFVMSWPMARAIAEIHFGRAA